MEIDLQGDAATIDVDEAEFAEGFEIKRGVAQEVQKHEIGRQPIRRAAAAKMERRALEDHQTAAGPHHVSRARKQTARVGVRPIVQRRFECDEISRRGQRVATHVAGVEGDGRNLRGRDRGDMVAPDRADHRQIDDGRQQTGRKRSSARLNSPVLPPRSTKSPTPSRSISSSAASASYLVRQVVKRVHACVAARFSAESSKQRS